MKLKIRYENEMQTIELDDAAAEQLWVSLSLDGEEAPEEERERMIQSAFDLKFNRPEYNCWHRETRYIDPSPKCRLMDGSRGLIRGDEESITRNLEFCSGNQTAVCIHAADQNGTDTLFSAHFRNNGIVPYRDVKVLDALFHIAGKAP